MAKQFNLSSGYTLENTGDVHQAFQVKDNNILCNVSFENLNKTITGLISLLDEPLFFFMEIPSDKMEAGEDSKDVYYLDNCTKPVILAIIKRYGDILFNDGIVEFGFGSHKTDDEIYLMKYNLLSIYSARINKFTACLDKMTFPKENNIVTVWDVFSDDNTGICSSVEVEGENIYDIIENLKEVGMYYSHTTQ